MAPGIPSKVIHEQWLGLVQPVGLVVAPAVLSKLEALLEETEHPIGLLSNGSQLRLVHAPRPGAAAAGKRYHTRPLIHKEHLVNDKLPWREPGGSKQDLDVVPVRFVQCCANGHLSDIDWDRSAHGAPRGNCQEDPWIDEAGDCTDLAAAPPDLPPELF